MKMILFTSCAAAICFAAISIASGQDAPHRHPPEHAQLHNDFYSKWMRPDAPDMSCCGNRDCFPVEIKYEGADLYAKSPWNGQWVLVPPNKIDRRNTSPDGQNHGCMTEPAYDDGYHKGGNELLCLILGQGI